jgi:uncharacterized protein (DUF885 family)
MRVFSAVILLVAAGCATTNAPLELKSIADEVWARQLAHDPAARARLGMPVEQMPDPSYEGASADAAFARGILERLKRIDPARLSENDRVTLSILKWRQEMTIEGLRHFWLRSPVTPYNSSARATALVFKQMTVSGDYVKLLGAYARYVDALAAVVREQQRRGILLPKAEIPLVRGTFAAMRRDPESSPFYRQSKMSAEIRDAITNQTNPALDRLLAVIGPDYEAAAPAAVGLSQYPGGAAAYRYLMKLETSLDLSPEEVHRLGVSEVERLEGELDAIRVAVGFQGNREEFHRFLTTDARFFESSPDAIRDRLARYVAKIEPHIDQYFARKPAAAYGVARLDPSLEGAMTFGYYKRPEPDDPRGLYYFNGSKTSERNLLFGLALMAHELVPGHHFQIARQEENQSLHPLRRENFDTAFVEGWGEYSAALGLEMGIYDDPYDHAGRLMMDTMLSSRLVVDTGMNALGWPRERAMQYLRDHSMMSETEIATETLRYSADIPAQALAYKIGSLRMMALRKHAQERLGTRFDIRQFHEWIIANGSMPLQVLEQSVEEKLR